MRLPQVAVRSARSAGLTFKLFFLAFGFQAVLLAHLPIARVSALFPPGGQAGTTVEVAVSGQDLEDTTALHFSHPGLHAVLAGAAPEGHARTNVFLVTIGAEVPPGTYEARSLGRFGLSNPRAFVVGDRPELTESQPGVAFSAPTPLPLDTIFNGQAEVQKPHYFRFAAGQGQRLVIECAAAGIDSRLNPVLILFDANGRELQKNRRAGFLDFHVPQDGEYTLKLHDFLHRGGNGFFFRLTVRTTPFLSYVWPPSGVAGSKSQFTLYGRNLPGGVPVEPGVVAGESWEQLSVEIDLTPTPVEALTSVNSRPASSGLPGMEYRLPSPAGHSNPVFISFAGAPLVLEQEPNNEPGQAQSLQPPCEVTGQFFPARDQDWYSFEGKRGDVYWIEIVSERLALPTNPFLLVQKVTGQGSGEEKVQDLKEIYDEETNVGGLGYRTSSRDPGWRLEVTEDAVYRLQVRDLFHQMQAQPRHVYRLMIRREEPDFHLVALPLAPEPPPDTRIVQPWNTFLRRGEVVPVKVLALRQHGFNESIELVVEDLPPGIQAHPARIVPGQSSTLLFLEADGDAASWSGVLRIQGMARRQETQWIRTAQAGTVLWPIPDYNNEPILARGSPQWMVAVTSLEATPVEIRAETDLWETAVAGKLEVPVRIARQDTFKSPLRLRASGIPGVGPSPELEVDAGATNAVLHLDLAQQKIPAGDHLVYLQGQTKGKYRKAPEAPEQELAFTAYGRPVLLRVRAAPLEFISLPEALEVEQGAPLEIQVQIQRLYGFTGPVRVRFVPASERKNFQPVENVVTEGQERVVLRTGMLEEALPGPYVCTMQATLQFNGQELTIEQALTVKIQPASPGL